MNRCVIGSAAGLLAVVAATTPPLAVASEGHHANGLGHDGRTSVEVGFVISEPTVLESSGASRVEVSVFNDGRRSTAITERLDTASAATIADSIAPGALVDFTVRRGEVVVTEDPANTFNVALSKSNRPVFDTKKYGAELACRDGRPGAMVAAGWVYGKNRDSITLGDGRLRTQRFDSRGEAEAVRASVAAGGTYRVDLTKASAIVTPSDGSPVFEAD